MIDYLYLQYWKETKEDIELLEKLLIEKLYDYLRTRESEHLEYIVNNANEIQRLELLKKNITKKYFIHKNMKNNLTSNKITTQTKNKIERKVRKTLKKLKTLYIEYELLQLTKTNTSKTNLLIDIISKTKYKYVCYLKKTI